MTTVEIAKKIAAPTLQLVQGGAAAVGSHEWSAKLRRDAKEQADELETGYIRMGELLHLAACTRDGGRDTGAPVYQAHWGYRTYEEWIEEELGLHDKKARSLRRIWERVGVELVGLDPDLRRRLLALGWTKVREVVRVLTLSNAQEWVECGERYNYHDFRAAVAKYADDLQRHAIEDAKAKAAEQAANAPLNEDRVDPFAAQEMPAPFSTGAGFSDKPSKAAEEDEGDDEEISGERAERLAAVVPMPTPERTIPFNFALYPDQADTLRQALDLAASHNPGRPKSAYLDHIALEYLAGYHTGSTPIERRVAMLHKVAELLDLDVVARDRGTGEVVYGLDSSLAKALAGGVE